MIDSSSIIGIFIAFFTLFAICLSSKWSFKKQSEPEELKSLSQSNLEPLLGSKSDDDDDESDLPDFDSDSN